MCRTLKKKSFISSIVLQNFFYRYENHMVNYTPNDVVLSVKFDFFTDKTYRYYTFLVELKNIPLLKSFTSAKPSKFLLS